MLLFSKQHLPPVHLWNPLRLQQALAFLVFHWEIMSKAFYGNEQQLEWLNAVRVGTREFIAFNNTQANKDVDKIEGSSKDVLFQVVEVGFSKPRPGADLELFWKPARKVIAQKVQNWIDYSAKKSLHLDQAEGIPGRSE
ncbi:hypothetical protein DTO013E5_1929 [Penicillium roqueforti]|nr:hypothetical protein CBS147332_3991 [Penicillium roqueforti]KAI2741086.1 hypothetical protein DTO012A1_4860 [Penicillium roqueforti]KAI2748769.1 hypothetical protein DTO013F2_6262 [Penicillium roqueforti]KAI2774373.1 hypothetical protein DTO012A8_1191 [Penicillium roqueforti]KAI3084877.1 hypothetical protein CBS147339_1127 [Penicillium roqueforti]